MRLSDSDYIRENPWDVANGAIHCQGTGLMLVRRGFYVTREANAIMTLMAASRQLLAACRVMVLTPETREYLSEHDPKALEQLENAIKLAEGETNEQFSA